MLDKINGLPAHPLLIHAIVILVPIAALMLVAGAVWPTVRARLGVATPALSLVVLVLVPITQRAGEWLRNRIDPSHANAAITRHARMGEGLAPWMLAIVVLATLVWWLDRRFELTLRGSTPDRPADREARGGLAVQSRLATRRALPGWVAPVITVLSVVAAAGAIFTLVRAGDSGATAAWDYVGKLPAR